MRPCNFVFITLITLCHPQLGAQTFTNGLPLKEFHSSELQAQSNGAENPQPSTPQSASAPLPDDPGQEAIPVAQPEPIPPNGLPVQWESRRQEWVGDIVTLTGDVVFHYRDYVIRADKVVYHRSTSEVEADGHLQVAGGPNDVLINAARGD